MRLKYRELRLKIPSLQQSNAKGHKGGSDWCGRTSAAMIYNYYKAAEAGGMGNAVSSMAVNRRDRPPYDLVLPDGTRIVSGYNLIGAIQKAKPDGWSCHPDHWDAAAGRLREGKWMVAKPLYPKEARDGKPNEAKIREILAGPLRGLEMFNPALCYTGLSSSVSLSRHIVVLSGYRVGPGGALWLHIDDPGSRYRVADDGSPELWGTAKIVMARTKETVLIQLEPETHDTRAGRRYWLKASRLFEPNHNSRDPDDLFCDHLNRPGLSVFYNDQVPTPASPCVVTSSAAAGLPIKLGDQGTTPAQQLALAHEQARTADAPYPLGGNRVWHNGIHLMHAGNDEVRSVAPGEIVFVRLPKSKKKEDEDHGAILVRHPFDPATLRILDPRGTLPKSVAWIYSLSMHLGERSREVFLGRLKLGDKPKKRTFLPAPAPCDLWGYDVAGEPVSLPAQFEAARDVDKDDSFKFKTAEGRLDGLVASPEASNLGAWEDQPGAIEAPEGVPLALWDPRTETLIEVGHVGKGADRAHRPVLATEADKKGRPEVAVVHKKKGTHWAETTDAPGIQVAPVRYCVHERRDQYYLDPPETILVDNSDRSFRQLGVAFFREQRLRVTAVVGGRKLRGWLELGDQEAEPMRFYDDHEQPGAEVGAKPGALLRPALSACVETSKASGGAALLYLYNDLTERVLPTSVKLSDPDVPDLAQKYGDYTAIRGVHVEVPVRLGATRACIHTLEEAEAMAETERSAWPLLTCFDDEMSVWLRTKDEGDRRWFPDACKVTIPAQRLTLSVADGPRQTGGRRRVWPRLSVVAGLDNKQVKALDKELDEAHDGPAGQTRRRLEQGESRLVGAQLSRNDGWEVQDGVLQVREGRTNPVVLYVEVDGQGAKRSFPERIDDCDRPTIEIDPAKWPGLRVVSEFRSNGKDRALVEVVPAVKGDAWHDNQADIDGWKQANKFVKAVENAIDGGEVVELATLEDGQEVFERDDNPFAAWRYTAGESIAAMGRLDPERFGVHLEMFAGDNILPSDGPNGLWTEITTSKDAGTDVFATEVASALVSELELDAQARKHRDDQGSVADALAREEPVPAKLWREFCADEPVHRALARVIAKHPTEWAVDWDAVGKQKGWFRAARRMTVGPTAGWWPTSIELEGLSGDAWCFYQPLRLIEWLVTGVDARVEVEGDEAAAMQFVLGKQDWEMAPSDNDEEGEVFRVRTAIGERAEHLDAAVRLGDGIDTAIRDVPVRLHRAEVVSLWLCEPTVELEETMGPIVSRAAVPYDLAQQLKTEDDETTYLLADPSDNFAQDGTSRATFVAEARYNVEMPTTLEVSVPDGLELVGVEVVGAAPLPAKEAYSTSEQFTLEPPEGYDNADRSMHRSVQARITVAATDATASGALSVAFSGGDLPGAKKGEAKLATRTIGEKAKGRDVAKLQQYLHHFRAGGMPCYRTEEGDAAQIDGDAGPTTGRAIWRFVLQHHRSGKWDRETSEIAGTKGSYSLDFEADPITGEDIEGAAKVSYDTYGFPTVDAGLIAELVRHFETPAVLPPVDLSVRAPALEGEAAELAEKMSDAGRSTLLPDAGVAPELNRVHVDVTEVEPKLPGEAGAIAVTITLGEGTPYALTGEADRTLKQLFAEGIDLTPNGIVASDEVASTLTIAGPDGTKLGSIRLGGARDLLADDGSAKALDAVLVQQWLAAWPRPGDGKSFYAGTLDGEWGTGSAKALAAFQDAELPDSEYLEAVAKLVQGPQAEQANEEAAQ